MKILAIQLKRIGDLVLTTPALVLLRDLHPEARIELLIDQNAAGLRDAISGVDRVHVYDKGSLKAGLWRKLILGRYGMSVDFTGNDRSAFITLLAKAKVRRGFERSLSRKKESALHRLRRLLPLPGFFKKNREKGEPAPDGVRKHSARRLAYTELVNSPVKERHTIDRYCDLAAGHAEWELASKGLPWKDYPPPHGILEVPDKAEKAATAKLEEAGIAGPFVIIQPGAARVEKTWPEASWAEALETILSATGGAAIFTGSAEPVERTQAEAIIAQLPPSLRVQAHMFCGGTSLLETLALVRRAVLVVSVDSAAVHLAGSQGTPVIGLYGPTNPFHWRVRDSGRAAVASAGQAAPLREFSFRQYKVAPMDELKPVTVVDAYRQIASEVRARLRQGQTTVS